MGWWTDIFSEPVLIVLVGLVGIAICLIALILVIFFALVIWQAGRWLLYILRVMPEPYWLKLKRELKEEKYSQ